MSSICQELFDKLYQRLVTEKRFTRDLVEAFAGLFGNAIFEILRLICDGGVRKLQTPSDRFIVQVDNVPDKRARLLDNADRNETEEESRSITYNFCFAHGNYCNCVAFMFDALGQDKFLWCKHLIAAKLALATDIIHIEAITEQEYQQICYNLMKIK